MLFFTQAAMSELKQVSTDTSLESHDSIVLFIMAHGQQGKPADINILFMLAAKDVERSDIELVVYVKSTAL